MIIAVEYKDGRIKEFDCSSFTSGDALTCVEKNAKNMVTEFDLRTDNIERDGLILNVFWHDVTKTFGKRELDAQTDTNGYSTEMAFAQRRAGYSVMICNKKVLNLISRIIVYRANGAVQVAWRQGSEDWLIKGSLFEAQRVLTYTDASTTSLNAQASTVFAYLRRAHPTLSDAEIADMMGYPPDALEEIMGELGMQDVSVVGAEGPASRRPKARDPVMPLPRPIAAGLTARAHTRCCFLPPRGPTPCSRSMTTTRRTRRTTSSRLCPVSPLRIPSR